MAPVDYDMNASFYFYKRNFFSKNYKRVVTEKSLCFLMDHVCFDIDHEIDFDIMDYLIKNNKLGFKL
jgi:CMP-N-acetylneuraminic acid synthetase